MRVAQVSGSGQRQQQVVVEGGGEGRVRVEVRLKGEGGRSSLYLTSLCLSSLCLSSLLSPLSSLLSPNSCSFGSFQAIDPFVFQFRPALHAKQLPWYICKPPSPHLGRKHAHRHIIVTDCDGVFVLMPTHSHVWLAHRFLQVALMVS